MPIMYRCSNCGKLLYYYITGFNDDSTGMRSVNDIINLYMGICPYCGKSLSISKDRLYTGKMLDIKVVEQVIERKRDLKKLRI
uniref:Uncharacterized protein n=1 Tax=Ignisphaera aggregans TaxID=334771 RepID=A0A7C5TJZ6_9CREN